MIRSGLIALIGAAIIGAAGCGPAAADSMYHERNETAQYTIDISYPLDFPDRAAVSDYISADRTRFLD